jgi:hypothetical protein
VSATILTSNCPGWICFADLKLYGKDFHKNQIHKFPTHNKNHYCSFDVLQVLIHQEKNL